MPPFQYQASDGGPAAGSIAALMLRRGEIAAQQAQQIAAAQARASEVGGAAWANAAGQIGNAVGGTIAQMTDPRRKLEAIQLQQAQSGQADRASLDAAYSPSGALGPGAQGPMQPGQMPSRQQIIDALPGHLKPVVQKQFSDADEAAAKVQETTANAQKATLEVTAAQNDYLGGLAATIRDHKYDPSAIALALSHARDTYANNPQMLQQIAQVGQHLQSDPAQVPAVVDALIKGSKAQQAADAAAKTADSRVTAATTGTKRLELETPKIAADTQIAQQNAAGTQPITPYQQAELGNRAAALKVEQGRLGIDQSRLGLERDKAAQTQNDKTELTPQGLDAAAQLFAKTGQLPALGMGDKTTRKAIINRAAEMVPGLDVASQKADFNANQSSLKNITGTLDTLTSFEKTAGKNLDQFLALADKIPDTGVPWLNAPVRMLNDKLVGSENQAAVNAARDVALREIARVTNDPKLSGVLSDSARHEVAGLSPANATFAQIKKVAQVLKQDMANVHQSLTEQQSAIQGRISGAGSAPKADPLGLFGPPKKP